MDLSSCVAYVTRVGLHILFLTIYMTTLFYLAHHRAHPNRPADIDGNLDDLANETQHLVDPVITFGKSSNKDFGGTWKFLTSWNFMLQIAFLSISLVGDLLLLIAAIIGPKASLVYRLPAHLIGALFHSLVYPLAIWVSLAFWTIYTYDPAMVVNRGIFGVPSWCNHSFHTVVAVAVVMESILVYHPAPSRPYVGLLALMTLFLGYGAWTLYLGIDRNIWPYPFLRVMSWPWRITVLVLFAILVGLIYVFGLITQRIIWNHRFKNSAARALNSKSSVKTISQLELYETLP